MRMLSAGSKIARLSPLSAAARRAGPLLAFVAGALTGCAAAGLTEIPAADVAPDQYQGMTCERIKSEFGKLTAQKANLQPALFSSMSEEERERQMAEVNGELKTLSLVSSEKCGTHR